MKKATKVKNKDATIVPDFFNSDRRISELECGSTLIKQDVSFGKGVEWRVNEIDDSSDEEIEFLNHEVTKLSKPSSHL